MHDHDHHHHDGGHHIHSKEGIIQEDDFPTSEYEYVQIAFAELLEESGYIQPGEINATIMEWENKIPFNGSRIVARAWVDPAFRQRLLADGNAAVAEFGFDNAGSKLVAVANTPDTHHLITCSLCSCYPRLLLGWPPSWYKSREYRSRTIVDPRGVLAEFGLNLPADKKLVVVDSTADCRYIVVPERPEGTEEWSETKLAALVTRESMIGVGRALTPQDLTA